MSQSLYNFSRFNVLVADSNAYMRNLICQLLHSYGVGTIIQVADAAAALVEMRTVPVDIVFVDWMLQPIDGQEFAKILRNASDSPNPMVPIITLSGHTEAFRVLAARDAGINEFLAKPVSSRTLFRRIVSVVEKPRPFIRTKTYFGPDRRRHEMENYNGPRRRSSDGEAADGPAPSGRALSAHEINALMNVRR